MDDFNDLFEEFRKKNQDMIKSSTKQMSDYVMNMDLSSLYPSTMTMVFPNKNKKISKIEKILDNINDTKRI